VYFRNDSDDDYNNLDVVITTDRFISAQAQTTNLAGVQIFNTPTGQDAITSSYIDNKTGKLTYTPENKVLMFTGGNRLICNRLPKHTGFEIVLAITVPPELGKPGISGMYRERTAATEVHIEGTYEGLAKKPHRLDITYPVSLN
jgi:hypothetical protein